MPLSCEYLKFALICIIKKSEYFSKILTCLLDEHKIELIVKTANHIAPGECIITVPGILILVIGYQSLKLLWKYEPNSNK